MKENKEIVEIHFTDPGTPLFIFLQEAVLPRGATLIFSPSPSTTRRLPRY